MIYTVHRGDELVGWGQDPVIHDFGERYTMRIYAFRRFGLSQPTALAFVQGGGLLGAFRETMLVGGDSVGLAAPLLGDFVLFTKAKPQIEGLALLVAPQAHAGAQTRPPLGLAVGAAAKIVRSFA